VRIISGKFKGRRLTGNKIFNARPTTDFARESLFNILNNYFFFDKIRVLDLFSGTGSISFEFISRGCKNVELVESDSKNFKLILGAIKDLNMEKLKPIKADAFWYIEKCVPGYDIIFADPPYASDEVIKVVQLVGKTEVLKSEGALLVEHPSRSALPEHEGVLDLFKTYKYGDTMLTLYRKAK
jgi:16S rRNA (guanine966-N2)-methyltransferase